jgi:hypothetical protein
MLVLTDESHVFESFLLLFYIISIEYRVSYTQKESTSYSYNDISYELKANTSFIISNALRFNTLFLLTTLIC